MTARERKVSSGETLKLQSTRRGLDSAHRKQSLSNRAAHSERMEFKSWEGDRAQLEDGSQLFKSMAQAELF